MSRITLDIDLNRVEGDLEFQLDLEDNVVVDARCIGTLYRGFEQLLIGRSPRDSLVITPRVCGICGTAHLYAATRALEQLIGVTPPLHATYVRNLCLMAETLQSDLRQTFLFFTPDFCHPLYASHPMQAEISAAFAPLKGSVVRGCLGTTRDLVGIVAIFGGQWPHSSYMTPGGITHAATIRHSLEARQILHNTRQWFEDTVLGDDLDAWMALDSAQAHAQWLSASTERQQRALGLMNRFALSIGLDTLGKGTENLLSYGLNQNTSTALPAGFFDGEAGQTQPLDHLQINEHVRHSWFLDYPGGLHPWQGETIPDHRTGTDRYTWAKAPRYGNKVVQTGPLAELVIAGEALVTDYFRQQGDNTWLRQFARLRRAGWLLQAMTQTLKELDGVIGEPHILDCCPKQWPDGESYGLVEAARGSLGHWLKVKDGVIEKYQIITPTAWNASPRDSHGLHGHWEQSIVGMRIQDPANPVEIGHIVRSHDPCLVCTVHFLGRPERLRIDV